MTSQPDAKPDKKSFWRDLARALRYLKPYWLFQVAGLACSIVLSLLALVNPWVNKLLIDDVILKKDARMLWIVCISFVLCTAINAAISVLRGYIFTYVGERAVIDIRCSVLEHLHRLSMSFFNQNNTGRVMSVFTSDIPAMQELYTATLVQVVSGTLQFAVTLAVMLLISWKLTLLSLLTPPLFVLVLKRFSRPVREISKSVQEVNGRISSQLHETIAGVREIKAFAQEKRETERLGLTFGEMLKLRTRQSILQTSSEGLSQFSALAGIGMVLLIGGLDALQGKLEMGALIAFVNYLGLIFNPIGMFMNLNNRLQTAMGAAERIFEFIDAPVDIQDAPRARALPPVKGRVVFENVEFGYKPGQKTLAGISLSVAPGQMVALVGPSGSGKTTLANLLPRFYDPSSGRILIDGMDIRHASLASLRREIGMVFQDSFLFSGSVRDNIKFGRPDASDAEVTAAAEAANAHEFIERLAQGYDTQVGERGVQLSGGQRQRIAIARTLLRNPRILILDEATASLDSESESLVKSALETLMTGRTSIVIAHRLSTIVNADQIVVLENGGIVESGSHEELLARQGVFFRLHEMQFGSGARAVA